jgi:hypothetical protein
VSPVKNLLTKGLAARARKALSVRFTVVAWTWTSTSTWLSLAASFSTSATRTTFGGP